MGAFHQFTHPLVERVAKYKEIWTQSISFSSALWVLIFISWHCEHCNFLATELGLSGKLTVARMCHQMKTLYISYGFDAFSKYIHSVLHTSIKAMYLLKSLSDNASVHFRYNVTEFINRQQNSTRSEKNKHFLWNFSVRRKTSVPNVYNLHSRKSVSESCVPGTLLL
jgi:hypothetical protein